MLFLYYIAKLRLLYGIYKYIMLNNVNGMKIFSMNDQSEIVDAPLKYNFIEIT